MVNALDYNQGVERLIPQFSGLSGKTVNRGSVSVRPLCWWLLNPSSLTHCIQVSCTPPHFSLILGYGTP